MAVNLSHYDVTNRFLVPHTPTGRFRGPIRPRDSVTSCQCTLEKGRRDCLPTHQNPSKLSHHLMQHRHRYGIIQNPVQLCRDHRRVRRCPLRHAVKLVVLRSNRDTGKRLRMQDNRCGATHQGASNNLDTCDVVSGQHLQPHTGCAQFRNGSLGAGENRLSAQSHPFGGSCCATGFHDHGGVIVHLGGRSSG